MRWVGFLPRSGRALLYPVYKGTYERRPVETSLIPMFRFQGAPDSDKRLVLLEGGHLPSMNEVIKETLDWLDRYLGPVEWQN